MYINFLAEESFMTEADLRRCCLYLMLTCLTQMHFNTVLDATMYHLSLKERRVLINKKE